MMGAKKEIRVAVIDVNNGSANQGMRNIMAILSQYKKEHSLNLSAESFDLRSKNEIPGIDYDIYISSGGPGSPFEGENEAWEKSFFDLLSHVDLHNAKHNRKKYVFLICHSFQLACRKYGLGTVTRRKSASFGIFPVSLTLQGEKDSLYSGLANPFYAVDSRNWQVLPAGENSFDQKGAVILAIEKERPGVDLERCIMSVRFSAEMAGTQFHPEADPAGMKRYLLEEEKKQMIIAAAGEKKYTDMLNDLEDPTGILLTRQLVMPNFLNEAVQSLNTSYD
ncbi:MAG TPA: GMP synthase [Pedobacter sp.]